MEGDARGRDGEIAELTEEVVELVTDQALVQTELDSLDHSHTALRQVLAQP